MFGLHRPACFLPGASNRLRKKSALRPSQTRYSGPFGYDGTTHCSKETDAGLFPQPALMFAFKGPDATICSAAAEGAGSEVRTAGDRTRRRRLNKLSCAGWLPHDRGFVSGLPRSKGRASVQGPAHNRAGGFPTAVLWPAMRISGMSLVVDLPDCSRRVWWLW